MNTKATILLLDDDVEFLRALNIALTSDGYTVVGAGDPCAAMDYVLERKQRFDVLITDVQMLGVDGLKVLAMVKQASPDIAVIVISAFAGPPSASRQRNSARLRTWTNHSTSNKSSP